MLYVQPHRNRVEEITGKSERDSPRKQTGSLKKNVMREKKVNLCALERFYYEEARLHINTQLKATDVYNLFSSPFRLTTEELFKEKLSLEDSGEKFEFKIRGFIYPTADKYRSIFAGAVEMAYKDFLSTFHKSKNF
ncbi:hypothetical protein SJC10_22 [Bacteroides phage SJC10]|nr:hypothetical protein SJC10_22 [Bacteroides phage SJC10]